MRLIKSYEEYRLLVKEFKKTHAGPLNNLYSLGDKFQKIITDGRFYYVEQPGALIFLSDEQNFYRLYFYQNDFAYITLPALDKDVLVEVIYKEDLESSMFDRVRESFIDSGASFFKRLHLYKFIGDSDLKRQKVEQMWLEAKERLKNFNLKIGSASITELDQVEVLLKEYLDEIDFEFHTVEEYQGILAQDGIIVVRDGSVVVGTITLEVSIGKFLELRVVVREDYQGRGIGKALLAFSLKKFIDGEYPVYNVWINDENKRSINFHNSMGIDIKDNKVMEQYVFNAH